MLGTTVKSLALAIAVFAMPMGCAAAVEPSYFAVKVDNSDPRERRLTDALAAYKKDYLAHSEAIDKNPQDAGSYLERAKLSRVCGHYAAAADDYEAAAVRSGDIDTLMWQALCLQQGGDNDSALWLAHKTLVEHPDCAGAHRVKALCIAFRDSTRALKEANLAVSEDPANASLVASLARILMERGDYAAARVALTRARALDAKYPPVYRLTSELDCEEKRYSEALVEANKLIDLIPYSPIGYRARSDVYRYLGRIDEAERDLELAVRSDSELMQMEMR